MVMYSLPSIVAMIFSAVVMVQLSITAYKVGGAVGMILKLLTAGIFFAVFLHAGIEFLERLGLIKDEYFSLIMSIMISFGSVFFLIAGHIAFKTFKK